MKKIVSTLITITVALSIAIIGSSILSPYLINSSENTDIVDDSFFRLVFSKEEFTVLQITDFHEWAGIERGLLSVTLMPNLKPHLVSFINNTLDEIEPDFVVVTGDNIFPLKRVAEFQYNVSLNTLGYIADIFEEREQYWTLTFGNHDTESGVSKERFLERISEYKYFIGEKTSHSLHKTYKQEMSSSSTQASRMGNYSIPVYREGDLFFNLFVLDSGSYYFSGVAGRDYLTITEEQTEWYISESNRLKAIYGNPVPSIMFTHIPIIEMKELYNSYSGYIYGTFGGISNSTNRSSIYDKCLMQEDVRAIFFGHNHDSSLTLFDERHSHRIMLGITPQCAASAYEDTTSPMYARVIKIDEDANFYTYIYSSESTNNHVYLDQIIRYNP